MSGKTKPLNFIDAFAGCGGLSLGLMQAGLQGIFAIEKDDFAFSTLQKNLLSPNGRYKFDWPAWLPEKPITIEEMTSRHRRQLISLRGKVDILAGGPPCQGFSTAGRRRMDDPRNDLFKSYVKLVRIIEPKIVLIENVRGFTMNFDGSEEITNYAGNLRRLLSKNYAVHERLMDLSKFGVPQRRTRYLLIALEPSFGDVDPFDIIEDRRPSFLKNLNLKVPVASYKAISDLEVSKRGTQPNQETNGYLEIKQSRKSTNYQKLMGAGATKTTDLRLAQHAPKISKRFAKIIAICHAEFRLNTTISVDIKKKFGLNKSALRVLDPDQPAPTITSMPDDLIHYMEPRTLTVRENARLQSFPDWFSFHGKYTTGGHLRRKEVPRFTQVANAVPPLAAQAIGESLIAIVKKAQKMDLSAVRRRGVTKGPVKITKPLTRV